MIKKLETERLILRELSINDAEEAYKNWTTDEDVARYVRWSPHKNIEETIAYLKTEEEKVKERKLFYLGNSFKR